MARQTEQVQFDYDSAPKGRERFPKSYLNAEVTVAEIRHADDGRAVFHLEGAICGPHRDGTDAYDGHPVYLDWYIGTDDDPEAEDPKTWQVADKKNLDETERKRAVGHDMSVENLISCLKAAKLTKGAGRGTAPWVLFPDLEGETLCIEFGERTGKDGVTRQTYSFHEKGAREPQLMGRAAPPRRREAEEPPAPRRGPRAVEPEDEPEELPRRRRA